MRDLRSACIALTVAVCAVGLAGNANAGRGHGHGGHGGHGHIGHGHGGHHGHHHGHFRPRFGFGVYVPRYSYYDDYPDDCYRVWRRGRYRIVCED